MRRRTAPIALSAVAAAFSLVLGFGSTPIAQSRNQAVSPPSASSGFKFTPVADAYVNSSKPSTNYGNGIRLRAEDAPVLKTYLRFAGGNISGQVTRATLWLYAITGSNTGYGVHTVTDNSWQESGITFASAPSISATPIGSAKGYVSGTWTTVDVTSAVSATGSANLALTTTSANALAMGSRESGSKSPVLVVQTTSPDVTPPSTPTGLLVTAMTGSSVSLSWSTSTDNVGVAGYGIYRGGTLVGSTPQTSYTLSGLSCATTYTVGVDAYDAAGNRSSRTPLVVATGACPDTTPPTDPTDLAVTSASATAISLSWSASTDNVGVSGYSVFLNGTLTASTGATTYSFTGLNCGTSYALAVQAYDAAGNRSSRSSFVTSTSPCLDTSAPTAPTGLAATAGSTSISTLWSPSFDNVGVTGYDVFLNGSKIGSTPLTNYTFGGLTCGTSYTVGVDAYDAAGNASTKATVTAATSACTSPPPPPQTGPQYRYIYNSGSDPAIAQNGWNLYDVSSKTTADALPAGTSALYWLGDYDNSSCSWQVSDSTVTTTVQRMVGDAKIFGYFISDEPNPYACPGAPAQHKARSDLIHSIDSSKKVVVVLDSNGFSGRATRDALDQLPLWKGTADVIGLDPYPCYQGGACDYTWIDRTIAAADSAGLNYWGVAQAFNDSSWRWPTPDEESHMLSQWAASKQSGYMTFAWTWAGNNLTSQPALLDVFKQFNSGSSSGSGSGGGADTTAPSTPTGLSKVSSNATSVSLSWNASTDNVGVGGYGVYRNGALVSNTSGTSYTIGGLVCGTSYTFSVDAYDAAGNRSAKASITATTNTCTDTAAPSPPTNLNATGATATSVSFSWTASTDNVGVTGYGVYRGGTLVASPTATNYTLSGLSCGTSYSIGVDAFDAVGNRSQQSSLTIATSPCPDSIAPTAPGTPTATSATTTSIALSWGPSLDNIGVVGYDLYSNTTKVGSTPGTNYTFGSLTCGTSYTLGVEAYDAVGNHSTRATVGAATAACASPPPPPPSGDPVITAAGDICGSATDCAPTAALIDQIAPSRVLTLGDNAYPDGASSDYASYYAPNWGRQKSNTSPAPGNHDYHTSAGAGYFGYFGSQAPGPYYSYDVGSWHLISLNGEIGVSAGSAQETWLKSDLAAHPAQCILAYWHEPRFSSGAEHGSDSSFDPFWRDLYAAGADIVLNGHDHDYERFAPQNPSGAADSKGIREFVVGTGGVSHYTFGAPVANSEVRDNTSFGVLKLTLHAQSYDWQFVPVPGASFTDSGSTACS